MNAFICTFQATHYRVFDGQDDVIMAYVREVYFLQEIDTHFMW